MVGWLQEQSHVHSDHEFDSYQQVLDRCLNNLQIRIVDKKDHYNQRY